MTFEIYDRSNSTWYNVLQYWAKDQGDGTLSDIDSANSGRTQDGKMHRYVVATKLKWNYVSVAVSPTIAYKLMSLVKATASYPTFNVRTDMVDGTLRTYECYSNNRVISVVLGASYKKVSFPIIEV